MTFELNLKCVIQHPTTRNHLEKTKIVWADFEKPNIITVRKLGQFGHGTWKIPIKLINHLSSLVEFTTFSFFTQAHPLQMQLVKKLILYCQSLTLSTGQSSSNLPKVSY